MKRLLDAEWASLCSSMGGSENVLSASRGMLNTDRESLDAFATARSDASSSSAAWRKISSREATLTASRQGTAATTTTTSRQGTGATAQSSEHTTALPLNIVVALWRQLILTCNAMANIALQKKKVDMSQQIARLASEWANREDILSANVRKELNAYVNEFNAYFYFRKKNYGIAMSLLLKAQKEYESRGQLFFEKLAINRLRVACVEAQNSRHKQAHEVNEVSKLHLLCRRHK